MFAGPIQTHFSPSRYASVKTSSEKAQNRFLPENRNCITDIITLEGIEKIKTKKKKTTKQSEEEFFHQRCKKTATNTLMTFGS